MTRSVKNSEIREAAISLGEDTESLKSRVLNSTLINIGLSVPLKILLFAQSIVLARIFTPKDLGIFNAAMMTVFIATLLTRMGADQAIIRERKDAEYLGRMIDTAMTLNLLLCLLVSVAVLLLAPMIASWTGHPESVRHIRFLTFLVFSSALMIPSALWMKNLRLGIVQLPLFIEVLTFITSTVVFFYWLKLGLWSLFAAKLLAFTANYTTLWWLAPYRPRLRFDTDIAMGLASFGWPLLFNALCNYLVWRGDQWLILYFWGGENLAYFVLAFVLPFYLKEIVDLASTALFPFFSQISEEQNRLAKAFSMSNKYLSILTVPIGVALCVFAHPIIELVYSEKWLPAVPLLQILSVGTVLSVILGYNWGSVVLVSGRTRYLLYTNLWIVFLLSTVGVYMVYRYGIIGGAYFLPIQVILTVLFFRLPIIYRELNSLSFLYVVWKPALAGVVSGGAAALFVLPLIDSIHRLLAGGIAFALSYLAVLFLLDRGLVGEARHFVNLALSR